MAKMQEKCEVCGENFFNPAKNMLQQLEDAMKSEDFFTFLFLWLCFSILCILGLIHALVVSRQYISISL
jgi:hypothetical protein